MLAFRRKLGQNHPAVKILAVSDQVIERLYDLAASGHFREIDLILGCGDLPYNYLEYLLTIINKPLMYVPGNHDPLYSSNKLARAEGATNVDLNLVRHKGLLIGGLGGSVRY